MRMKNILLLTPIYPASDLPGETTPVIHYFVKEWVKMGYNILVINYVSNFPRILYKIASPFADRLSSIFSFKIRTQPAVPLSYKVDEVQVKRIPLYKLIPHGAYSKKELERAFKETIKYCETNHFYPDCIIGHWLNPQLVLMYRFKQYFHIPTVLVLHDWGKDLTTVFKKNADLYISSIDLIGFRSKAIERMFNARFNYQIRTFYCYSGIPTYYLSSKKLIRRFSSCNTYIYVGTLIRRKYPAEIVLALSNVYKNSYFHLTYIGDGIEKKRIIKYGKERHCIDRISLLGRMDRLSVRSQLLLHDIFIMISKNETFGLVYLEAMSVGCITIAARNEGFDGIIEDGKNGFLCEAGNVDELCSIITRIRKMDKKSLEMISLAAIETAEKLTDANVAKFYIEEVEKLSR